VKLCAEVTQDTNGLCRKFVYRGHLEAEFEIGAAAFEVELGPGIDGVVFAKNVLYRELGIIPERNRSDFILNRTITVMEPVRFGEEARGISRAVEHPTCGFGAETELEIVVGEKIGGFSLKDFKGDRAVDKSGVFGAGGFNLGDSSYLFDDEGAVGELFKFKFESEAIDTSGRLVGPGDVESFGIESAVVVLPVHDGELAERKKAGAFLEEVTAVSDGVCLVTI